MAKQRSGICIKPTTERKTRWLARGQLTGRSLTDQINRAMELYLLFPPDYQPGDIRMSKSIAAQILRRLPEGD